MSAIATIRRRVNVWYWRARYWLLDTPAGVVAQRRALMLALVLNVLAVLVGVVRCTGS
jgi:hypothetical protein